MKIDELATPTGITPASLRFYETQGLLPAPAGTGSNYRDYTDEHVARLHFFGAVVRSPWSSTRSGCCCASGGRLSCGWRIATFRNEEFQVDQRTER